MNLKFSLYWILMLFTYMVGSAQYHSIDGSVNNLLNPEWGSQGDQLSQITSNGFSDGISELGGLQRPNPRYISNQMFTQSDAIFDEQNHSDFVWVFGQFLDHDIILVENDNSQSLVIEIPDNDPVFISGGAPINMQRSAMMEGSGIDAPAKYANHVTAYIDGSGIYGSDMERAAWLRTFEGGKLKTSFGELLPWNTRSGEFNDPRDRAAPSMDDPMGLSPKHFIAGDVRANENPLLTTFHTLFVREHNRIAQNLAIQSPDMTDEELYFEARRWVIAYIQKITFYEWLPSMGVSLPAYRGYREDTRPQISNVFSAAAFRMGHTLINSNVLRLEAGGEEVPGGSIGLRDAFFNPLAISLVGGLEPYLRGMASQVQQKLDCKVVDDVRNFLFGVPEAGGMDLAAININRGRERGLPDFNTIRKDLGLPAIKSFEEISNDLETANHLEQIYASINDIDPWVGMLSEDYMPDAMFGSTIMNIIERQFQQLRDGDRYFFEVEDNFTQDEISDIKNTTFRDIIMRNTDIKIMQNNVFEAIIPEEINDGPDLEPVALNAAAYPNPTFDNTSIKVYSDEDVEAMITVFDNQGRKVLNFSVLLREGNNQIPLELAHMNGSMAYNVLIGKSEFEYSLVRVVKL